MERATPVAVVAVLAFLQASPARSVEILHSELISDLQMTGVASEPRADAANDADASATSGPIAMTFNAFGERFVFALEPNAPINTAAHRLGASDRARAYRGTLRDRPGSWVRIVTADSGPAGLVWDGVTLYGIEPAPDSSRGSDTTMFRLDDVYVPPGTMSCGVADAPMTGSEMFAALATEARVLAAAGATLNLDIGAVADFEFSQAYADPSAAIVTRLNNVDGIFSEQVGVQITVQEIDVFTTDSDPFTTSIAGDLLDELATYRSATAAQHTLGLTHLFTGRNLDGTTVGVAYLGALCSSFGAGLTSARNNSGLLNATIASLIAAHEIGHNFGAPHDGDQDGACATTPETFLMAPQLNPLFDEFSACSIEQMETEIATASCLTELDFVDVALSANSLPAEPLAGVPFDYTVTATNEGAAQAAGVSVALTFDAALEVIAVTPAAGTCGAPQSSVTCALGALAGSTSRSITARLRATAVGGHAITGTATATDDVAIANDSFDATVSVEPAVDLAISAGTLRIERDQRGSLAVTVRNLAGIPAQSVELSAQASAGLRIDSATIDGQTCMISGDTATCATASITSLASASIAVGLTGLVSGAASVNLTASALERDTNVGDNALTASVEVFDPPAAQGSDDGGGGGTGPWSLLALLCAGTYLRRSRHA